MPRTHGNLWRQVFLTLMLALLLKPSFALGSAEAINQSGNLCSRKMTVSAADRTTVTSGKVTSNSQPAASAAGDVMSIMKQMKEILEPVRSSIQKIVITRRDRGEKDQNIVLQAFKKLADGRRRLMLVLEPKELKGMAFLVRETAENKPDVMWTYDPSINRVRELLDIDQYASFFGTTFTYADLGFVKLHDRYTLLGEEKSEDRPAYKVEEKRLPGDYYSRIIIWIAKDSKLPLKRDFYSAGKQLWKTEFFKDVTVIDGTLTPIRILMSLVDGRTSTEFKLVEVNYDVNLPDELFYPNRLSTVATHPVWKSYSPKPVTEK